MPTVWPLGTTTPRAPDSRTTSLPDAAMRYQHAADHNAEIAKRLSALVGADGAGQIGGTLRT